MVRRRIKHTASAKPRSSTARRYLDLFIRLALGSFFALLTISSFAVGIARLQKMDSHTLTLYQISQTLSLFTVGLYTLILASLYVIRLRPTNRFMGLIPSTIAILGGFFLMALLLLDPRMDLPSWAMVLADGLIIMGTVFSSIALFKLGRSFSILPEARRLVTRGLYARIRHPLYLGEAITTLGVAINFLSPVALLLVTMQFALQIARIHYEEKILKENFPAYAAYAKKTWRLIPGVY